MISLFSPGDEEMLTCKTGDWYSTNPQRARANNSAVLKRDRAWEPAEGSGHGDVWGGYRQHLRAQFERAMRACREWGDPGLYFTDSREYGANPCVEVGMLPKLLVTLENLRRVRLAEPGADVGESLSGFQGCNLTEINAATVRSKADFLERCRVAAFIGTLQAGYTNFPYLGTISEEIFRNEALLGVSLTGLIDNPDVMRKSWLTAGAFEVRRENRETARAIGIKPAARTTAVKPSGTASLVLGGVGSGCHDHHASESFRRVRASTSEPHAEFFRTMNPERAIWIDDENYVLEFCIKAPPGAKTRDDTSAIEFLRRVRTLQKYWVEPGTAYEDVAPGLRHNVSNTVTVRDDEWYDVQEYVWNNRDHFGGLSFQGYYADGKHPFAPRQALLNRDDAKRFRELRESLIPPDYSTMIELEDTTNLQGEVACAGGACEI